MSEDNVENEAQVNFYKLDRSKPYKVEGAASVKLSKFMFVFSSVFIAGVIIWSIVCAITSEMFQHPDAIFAPILLVAVGLLFLLIGVLSYVKDKKRKASQNEILKNCVLTDGKITEYNCVARTSGSGDNEHTYYDVTMQYAYYDESLNLRKGSLCHTYSFDPEFHKGEYLMIAFNETDSLILSEFTLEKQDEEKFLSNEAKRSDDDFDGLTGELLDVDTSKPIKTIEFTNVWLLAALVLFVFTAIYSVLMGVLVIMRHVDFKHPITDVVLICGVSLLPVIFFVLIAYFLYKYAKRQKYIKKLMNSNPYFTMGKLFASEKTYRAGRKKKILYCYIDKWGERHTDVLNAVAIRKNVEDQNYEVTVAYDAAGNSLVLYEYELIEKA